MQFVIGGRFYVAAWKALRARTGNMDLLVALGTSAAYFYSVFLVVAGQYGYQFPAAAGRHNALITATAGAGQHTYFEAAAVVITLVLFGRWLEARTRRATGAPSAPCWRSARKPPASSAAKARSNCRSPPSPRATSWWCAPASVSRPTARVLTGASQADESLITGESLPVDKQPGD